jgi:hypothetical protein
MLLFRAASPGDWKGTIARVVDRLTNPLGLVRRDEYVSRIPRLMEDL